MSQLATGTAAESGRRYHKITTPFDGVIEVVARRIGGGAKAKEIERFIKFAFVGILGFFIDSGTVILLQNTALPPVSETDAPLDLNVAVATSIAFILAVCSNFVWNRLWTYPDSRSRTARSQLTQFVIVSVLGWAIRTIWIDNSYRYFSAAATTFISSVILDYQPALVDEHKLGTMIALLFGVIVVMFWNFLANRYWTYNDVD